MMTQADVCGWAEGLDRLLSGSRPRFGRPACGGGAGYLHGLMARWSSRTAGSWRKPLAMRAGWRAGIHGRVQWELIRWRE